MNTNELEKGIFIIVDKQPYEILETARSFKGRGHSVIQTKLKNLLTAGIISKTFHPSDNPEECELEKLNAKFIYSHKNKFVFSKEKIPSERFELSEEQIGQTARFLKPNQIVETLIFQGKIISISLPIKISFKVAEAPPGFKGNRSQPGNKIVVLETGAKMNTPLFIEQGDIIEVNTETGEYIRRV
jgi:elongation factor P